MLPSYPLRRTLLAVALVAMPPLVGCSKRHDEVTAPSRVATAIAVVSGDQQRGLAGEPLTTPLVVRVTDQFGLPMAGVVVAWNVVSGGGALSQATSVTDGNGLAQNTWTLGRPTGTGAVAARIGALATQTALFSSTAFVL